MNGSFLSRTVPFWKGSAIDSRTVLELFRVSVNVILVMWRLFEGGHYYAQLWDCAAPIRGRLLNAVRCLFDERVLSVTFILYHSKITILNLLQRHMQDHAGPCYTHGHDYNLQRHKDMQDRTGPYYTRGHDYTFLLSFSCGFASALSKN